MVKLDIYHLIKHVSIIYFLEYANEFIHNMVLGDTKTYVDQFIFDKYDSNNTNILQ